MLISEETYKAITTCIYCKRKTKKWFGSNVIQLTSSREKRIYPLHFKCGKKIIKSFVEHGV